MSTSTPNPENPTQPAESTVETEEESPTVSAQQYEQTLQPTPSPTSNPQEPKTPQQYIPAPPSQTTPPPPNVFRAIPYGETVTPLSQTDEKMWATFVHLSGLFGFLGIVPTLIAYLVLKNRGPFIHAHVKTALNWQITLLLAWAVGFILLIVLIGFLVHITAVILMIVYGITAAMKAHQGWYYTIPPAIRFIK